MLIQPANELFIFSQENLHEQLALGLLAGNVFDWGAKEVALLMESGTGLRFEDALKFGQIFVKNPIAICNFY